MGILSQIGDFLAWNKGYLVTKLIFILEKNVELLMNGLFPHCYSQRMLNPFRGVMNVIDTGEADAVSTDGKIWTLYLRDSNLQNIANDGDMNIEVPDIRFGIWSAETGLKRCPLLNTMNYDAIQTAGLTLLDSVKYHAKDVPFNLADHYELWLLDKYMDLPLALLHSECFKSELSEPEHRPWTTGMLCRQNFQSPYLHKNHPDNDSQENNFHNNHSVNHAQWLTEQINSAAGNQPKVQWFLRDRDRNGLGLKCSSTHPQLEGRTLPKHFFPKLLINHDWVNQTVNSVVKDYLGWHAPWLLLLQHFGDATRSLLEKMACKQQALAVDAQQQLYPKIINEKAMKAARVEATMRKANGEVSSHQRNIDMAYLAADYF